MKYLRVFEEYFDIFDKEKFDNIKIGDYIIGNYKYDENPVWTEYIRKSAGKIVDIIASTYDVKYIVNEFAYNTLISEDKRKIKKEDDGSRYIIINFRKFEIKDVGSTAIELEMKISTAKYNL